MDELKRLNLMLFDDGGAGAAAGDGGGGEAAGVTQADAAPEMPRAKNRPMNPLAGVKYGQQAEPAAADAAQQETVEAAPEPEAPEESWEQLRNGRYKAQFDSDVQQIVRDRLKNSKQAEAQLNKLAPMLEALSRKYGTNAGDLDSLINKVTDDDSLYEDEALERGIPVETLKQMKALEQENQAFKAQAQANAEEAFFQQHIQNLVQQGEAVKATFPDFDLRAELQNETFRRLTSPEGGVDVMTAYQVVHRDQIAPMAMQVAAQKTAQQVSASIAAKGRRPVENGARSTAAAEVRDDPTKLKKRDFDEIARRVQRGERIVF